MAVETVNLAVASNFSGPMKALLKAFQVECNCRLRVSYGSSGRFYAQIRQGAPFHAFLSADRVKVDGLEQAGLTIPGSRFTYAQGRLVLWAPSSSQEPLAKLKTGSFRHLAIANPTLAPYGLAASQVLEHLGMAQQTKPLWVRGENIAQTYQFVHSGNAELGFIARSQWLDLSQKRQGEVWQVPENFHQPINQDAALLAPGKGTVAEDFMHFLKTPAATQIITEFGYQVPKQTSPSLR